MTHELVARADDGVCHRRIDISLVDALIGYRPGFKLNAKPSAEVPNELADATVRIA
jgi:hypothetical protein